MDKKKGKKKPTSDPRSPYDEFKPEKKSTLNSYLFPAYYILLLKTTARHRIFKNDNPANT